MAYLTVVLVCGIRVAKVPPGMFGIKVDALGFSVVTKKMWCKCLRAVMGLGLLPRTHAPLTILLSPTVTGASVFHCLMVQAGCRRTGHHTCFALLFTD